MTVIWSFSEKTFLVLTDKCLDLEPDSHCESATIGSAISGAKDLSFTCAHAARWNLGRRIHVNVKLSRDLEDAIKERESLRLEVSKIECELPKIRPVSRIYIYCGPCACAIQTALNLTLGNDDISGVDQEYFDFAIRIDERLPTSCRRSSTDIDVLTAIRDSIDGHVVSRWSTDSSRSIGFVDSPELERRIYSLEQERFVHLEPAGVLQKILLEDHQKLGSDLEVSAIILIAEADLCHLSLESRPFGSEARKPRETDIFAFKSGWVGDRTWDRRYLGSYGRSAAANNKRRAQSSLLTDPTSQPASNVMSTTLPISPNKRKRADSASESEV